MRKAVSRYYPGGILLALFIAIALSTYQDYGVIWDSSIQREMGTVSYDYIFHGDNKLDTYIERDHGVGFELVLLFVEKAVGARTFRDIFLARHLASHLFFLMGALAMYLLALRLFQKQWMAILAFLFFVLSPRLYAHSFFNPKDIPLLTTFAISFLVAEWAFRKEKAVCFIMLGCCVGYATSIRILGVYLFSWLFLFLAVDLWSAFKAGKGGRAAIRLAAFTMAFAMTLYAWWPTLWKDPVNSFISCFKSYSHFRWDGLLLLNGEFLRSIDLPWYYLPEWFSITTPVVYLVFGVIGFILLARQAGRRLTDFIINTAERNFLLYAVCFIGPFLIIILTRSVVYDDWRHLYFVYPSFILITLYGLDKLMSVSRLKWFSTVAVLSQLAAVAVFMWRAHPLHQVYFNEFVPHKEEYLRTHFDYDYWGGSYKQAIEYILKSDKRDTVKIEAYWEVVEQNIQFLKAEDQARVQPVAPDQAEYALTNFRTHPQDYDYPEVYYEIKVQNSTVVRVYKLR